VQRGSRASRCIQVLSVPNDNLLLALPQEFKVDGQVLNNRWAKLVVCLLVTTGSAPFVVKFSAIEADELVVLAQQAGQIPDTKTPGDAPAFKAWLKGVAEHVAEAASEGFGGQG
jgi:hypothetical protein